MHILFVDNLLLERKHDAYVVDLQPHLGLISLVAVVESAGHRGLLYDPKLALFRGELPLDESLYVEMAKALLRPAPDVVGFTTLGCNFICTLKVASYLKTMNPELPILLGGPHASILHQQIMERFPQFDVVVRNEAEDILLPLLEALPQRRFESLAGITFRRDDRVVANPGSPLIADLDTLPRASYQHYPIEELNLRVLRVEAGRGCPFNCTFCSTASFFGRKYRLKSAEHLCAELDYLHARYGITHFALTHDLFTVNRAKVREFCNAVRGRGYTWTCSARMDCVDPDLLACMRSAGCVSIYYGVETGSERMQKTVEKRLDLALFTPTLDATRRVGMAATASFITGYPEEEQADQDATLDMIGSCFARYREGLTIQLHLLTPEPGTRLIHEFADALRYDGHISDFNFPTLEPDDGEIMRQSPEVFMNHHYYQAKLPRQRHVFITSIHPLLYQLGFPILAHLVSYYEGKLSRLYSRMFDWAEQINASPPFTEDFVNSFMEHERGNDHYLSSLIRYMFTAIELPKRVARARHILHPLESAKQKQMPEPLAVHYLLSPGAAILRDIHNCPDIVKRIEESESLQDIDIPEVLRIQRGHYLLFLDQSARGIVRNFDLSEATAKLMEYFSSPCSYQQYLEALQTTPEAAGLSEEFFEELLHLGIIRSTDSEQADDETNSSGGDRPSKESRTALPIRAWEHRLLFSSGS